MERREYIILLWVGWLGKGRTEVDLGSRKNEFSQTIKGDTVLVNGGDR